MLHRTAPYLLRLEKIIAVWSSFMKRKSVISDSHRVMLGYHAPFRMLRDLAMP